MVDAAFLESCGGTAPEKRRREKGHMDAGVRRYMYNALVAEGHDARELLFSPIGALGGAQDPANLWHWVIGCLGVTTACTAGCGTALASCMVGKTGDPWAEYAREMKKFGSCEGSNKTNL